MEFGVHVGSHFTAQLDWDENEKKNELAQIYKKFRKHFSRQKRRKLGLRNLVQYLNMCTEINIALFAWKKTIYVRQKLN